MVCAQVIGNDATIAFAGAAGNFELNVMLPVLARNLLESIRLLANVSRLLADRCVDGVVADEDRCRELAESSPSIVTPLNKYIGYEAAAKVAKQALKERKTIRQVVLEGGYVDKGRPDGGAAGRGARRAVDDPAAAGLVGRPSAARRRVLPGRPPAAAGRPPVAAGRPLPPRAPVAPATVRNSAHLPCLPDTPLARPDPGRAEGPHSPPSRGDGPSDNQGLLRTRQAGRAEPAGSSCR